MNTTNTQDPIKLALDCIRASTEYKIGNPAFEQAESALAVAIAKAALQPAAANTQDPKEMEKLARECGATPYVNRHYPGQTALAFGPEAWAKFCGALQPAAAQPLRCPHCDDTGDVHDATGEWRGRCVCRAAQPQGDARRAEDIAAYICQCVAELPDRNSPKDWPEAMLVTHDELRLIVIQTLQIGDRK